MKKLRIQPVEIVASIIIANRTVQLEASSTAIAVN